MKLLPPNFETVGLVGTVILIASPCVNHGKNIRPHRAFAVFAESKKHHQK
jgi:hypothetical protein